MKLRYVIMALFDALVVAVVVKAAALRVQPTPDIVWALVMYLFGKDAVESLVESRKPAG